MVDLVLVALHILQQLAHEVDVVLTAGVEVVQLPVQHIQQTGQITVILVELLQQMVHGLGPLKKR
jgi:hypothetical protein